MEAVVKWLRLILSAVLTRSDLGAVYTIHMCFIGGFCSLFWLVGCSGTEHDSAQGAWLGVL